MEVCSSWSRGMRANDERAEQCRGCARLWYSTLLRVHGLAVVCMLLLRHSCVGIIWVVTMTCDGRSGCCAPPWHKTAFRSVVARLQIRSCLVVVNGEVRVTCSLRSDDNDTTDTSAVLPSTVCAVYLLCDRLAGRAIKTVMFRYGWLYRF